MAGAGVVEWRAIGLDGGLGGGWDGDGAGGARVGDGVGEGEGAGAGAGVGFGGDTFDTNGRDGGGLPAALEMDMDRTVHAELG